MTQYVIFTDLDGTMIDKDTYSFARAVPAIRKAKEKGVPIIFCTSKTRAEIEEYRHKMGIFHPFISEDGGAIFIPHGYFGFRFRYSRDSGRYHVIELGTAYDKLIRFMRRLGKKYHERSFADMTAEELARDAGLSIRQAELAKKREYDVVFKITDPRDERPMLREIRSSEFKYTRGGRYYHLIGRSSKGRAVVRLKRLYARCYKRMTTIGIGDSPNDFPMLRHVDVPILVKRKEGSYATDRFHHAPGIGPEGWNKAVLNIIGT